MSKDHNHQQNRQATETQKSQVTEEAGQATDGVKNVGGALQETAATSQGDTARNEAAASKKPAAAPKVTFDDYVAMIHAAGSDLAKYAAEFMANYVENMATNKLVSLESTKQMQVSFWKNLQVVMQTQTEDFKQAWDAISAFVKKNREGVFSDTFAFRQVTVINLSDSDRKAFLAILTLLTASADVVNKADLAKVLDLNKVLHSPSFTENMRAHLIQYYMQ